ncbi:MAG TPA: hypothetical protein VFN41_03535 [Candidatus Limnocylindrales bacterium]|nr:hypothetical protein [Candidatus Limnocylindrales bacterium]
MREDVRSARAQGRQLIALVLLIPVLAVFWWVAQPGFTGGPWVEPWYSTIVPWVGWTVYGVGVIWMIRIHRTSHLEPQTSSWRYRD